MSLEEELRSSLGEEFEERLASKLKEYHQLIPRDAALYLISLETGGVAPKVETLAQALQSYSPVLLQARIERIFPPRILEKNGRQSKSQRAALSDQTGAGTLVVYDSACAPLEQELMSGDLVEAGPVRMRGGEFHLLGNGRLTCIQKGPRARIKEDNTSATTIANFEGTVSAMFGDFPYRRGQSRLSGETQSALMTSFELADESGRARVVLWDSPGLAGQLKEGQTIGIENGTRRGGEIHINSAGRLLMEKMEPAQRPKIEEIRIDEKEGCIIRAKDKVVIFASLEDAAMRMGAGPVPDGVQAATIIELKKKDWIGRSLPVEWEEKKKE